MGFGQPADPSGGRGERDPVSGLGGGDRQRGSQVGFAGARRAEQDDVAGLGQPATGLQAGDLGSVDAGLGGEVEVGDRLDRREPGIADALTGTGFRASIGLHRQHGGQVILQRPVSFPALFSQPVIVRSNARCLQQSGLMRDELVDLTWDRGTFGGHQATSSPVPNAAS